MSITKNKFSFLKKQERASATTSIETVSPTLDELYDKCMGRGCWAGLVLFSEPKKITFSSFEIVPRKQNIPFSGKGKSTCYHNASHVLVDSESGKETSYVLSYESCGKVSLFEKNNNDDMFTLIAEQFLGKAISDPLFAYKGDDSSALVLVSNSPTEKDIEAGAFARCPKKEGNKAHGMQLYKASGKLSVIKFDFESMSSTLRFKLENEVSPYFVSLTAHQETGNPGLFLFNASETEYLHKKLPQTFSSLIKKVASDEKEEKKIQNATILPKGASIAEFPDCKKGSLVRMPPSGLLEWGIEGILINTSPEPHMLTLLPVKKSDEAADGKEKIKMSEHVANTQKAKKEERESSCKLVSEQ